MAKKSKDGIELFGLGKVTLDDVFNDPNGIKQVGEDEEYYYVFPDYKPGNCGDTIWMINKQNRQVSFTNTSTLVVYDVVDRLKDVSLNVFKERVS